MNFIVEAAPKTEALWGISRDTVFTVSITIFIFFIGFIINRFIEIRKENKRLNELRVYFFTLISSIPNSITDLIKHTQALAKDILDRSKNTYTLTETHKIQLDNIQQISHSDLFQILVSKRKTGKLETASKEFNNLLNTFSYLRDFKGRSRGNFKLFMADVAKYSSNWNTNIELLEFRFQEFLTFNRNQRILPSDDEFLQRFDRIFYNWTQTDDFPNLFRAKAAFVDPLIELSKQFNDDPRVVMIMPFVTKMQKAHKEFLTLIELYGHIYTDEAEKLENIKRQFTQAVRFFNPL